MKFELGPRAMKVALAAVGVVCLVSAIFLSGTERLEAAMAGMGLLGWVARSPGDVAKPKTLSDAAKLIPVQPGQDEEE
jgi:hypothetical protein